MSTCSPFQRRWNEPIFRKLQFRQIVLYPFRPAFEQMVHLGGYGAGSIFQKHNDSLCVQYFSKSVRGGLQDLRCKVGHQIGPRCIRAVPVEIKSQFTGDNLVHRVVVSIPDDFFLFKVRLDTSF